MEIISFPSSKKLPITIEKDGNISRSEKMGAEAGQAQMQFVELRERNSSLEQIASKARILIIEGISGSGKDTFQRYLKKLLNTQVVHDYTEGEVLHSWKQFQIEGILELRLKFMKLFVSYMQTIIKRDQNAMFLLNRFHLSTYAWAAVQHQKLGADYDDTVRALRELPVHIFILHVDEHEIEKRSLHPERSGAWQKFQQQIVENYTFGDRQEKQQGHILEAARIQEIPHSVIKMPPYDGRYNRFYTANFAVPNTRSRPLHSKAARKRAFQIVREDN